MPKVTPYTGDITTQYQRSANWWEKALTALQTSNFAMAGGVDAIAHGENPITGAGNFIRRHQTFQDTLENMGVTGTAAIGGGFALDLVADPVNFIGINKLTTAGRLARAAKVGLESAVMAGDAAKVAEETAKVAEFGTLAASRARQAASGQRAILEFAGHPVLYGEKAYAAAEAVTKAVSNTTFGKTVRQVFNTAQTYVPEALKLRNMGRKAAVARRMNDLARDIGDAGGEYYAAMQMHGIEPTVARDILRDSIELSKADIGATKLVDHMDEATKLKYVRWVQQAEGAKRGLPTNLGQALRDIPEPNVGQLPRPNIGDLTTPTETSVIREGLTSSEAQAAVAGRPLKKVTDAETEFSGRGNPILRASSPNLLGLASSWNLSGRMPEELTSLLPKNTARAIRRAEDRAIAAATASRLNTTMRAISEKYGVEYFTGLEDPLRKAIGYINMSNAAFLTSERAARIKVSELGGWMNYLKRAVTPEAQRIIAERHNWRGPSATGYEFSVRFASQLTRDESLRDLTITEVNRLAQEGKLTNLLGDAKVKLFDDEPFHATFVRGTESIRATESARMMDDAMRAYGKEVGDGVNALRPDAIPAGYSTLSTRLAEDLGFRRYGPGQRIVKDMAVPDDIAKLLESHYERVITPQYLQPVLDAADKITTMWKQVTLPIWPSYHTRNLASDLVLITVGADDYALHPMQAISSITDATRALAGHEGQINIGSSTLSPEEFHKLLDKFGLVDVAPVRDLDEKIIRPTRLPRFGKSRLDAVSEGLQNSKPIELGIRAGMFRQNATNAGYFLGLLRQGISPEVAALEVKKRLFDFGDLTDVERQIFRRVFPFYAWLRHNLPYQIKAAAQTPRTLNVIPKLREAMSSGEGPAGDVPLPGFLRDAMPMMLPFGTQDKPQFARLQGLFPQGDLSALGHPADIITNNLSPFIKTPIEVARNYDLFQNQPLERFPGDTTKRFGIDIAKRWTPVVDMIRPLNEANNLVFRDAPIAAKLESLAFARSYEVDTDLQTRLMAFKLKQNIADAKQMMAAAARRGDTKNVIAIRKWLQSNIDNPAGLLR